MQAIQDQCLPKIFCNINFNEKMDVNKIMQYFKEMFYVRGRADLSSRMSGNHRWLYLCVFGGGRGRKVNS